MRIRPRTAVDPAEVAGLGKVLLMSREASRREWAARTLAERGMVCAYAYLRHAFWDPVESVRESAVQAVAALAVRQSAAELAALYAWSGPKMRMSILRAVRRIDGGSGFDAVLRLARDDPDSRVRLLASRAGKAAARVSRRS
jgi:hypothetical protein